MRAGAEWYPAWTEWMKYFGKYNQNITPLILDGKDFDIGAASSHIVAQGLIAPWLTVTVALALNYKGPYTRILMHNCQKTDSSLDNILDTQTYTYAVWRM
jgi:hypothetical protein